MILYKSLESIKIVLFIEISRVCALHRKNNFNTQYAIEHDNFIYVE